MNRLISTIWTRYFFILYTFVAATASIAETTSPQPNNKIPFYSDSKIQTAYPDKKGKSLIYIANASLEQMKNFFDKKSPPGWIPLEDWKKKDQTSSRRFKRNLEFQKIKPRRSYQFTVKLKPLEDNKTAVTVTTKDKR